jgi:hypothetical protein
VPAIPAPPPVTRSGFIRYRASSAAEFNFFSALPSMCSIHILEGIFYPTTSNLFLVHWVLKDNASIPLFIPSVYLIGLSIRLKRTFLHLGYDSLLVGIEYLTAVYMMFSGLKS